MSLRHAILGILSIKPMSGYELKKVIDESVGHFWTADQSQIYRTLAGLVEDGLAVRRTVVQEERPNMHLHSVTDLGSAELDRWLASPLKARPSREPFLARLFFADRMPVERIRELLDTRRRELSGQLAALEAIEVPADAAEFGLGGVLRLATLANGIAHARTELDWLDATERRLEGITS
ncbi:PadR family transcriptional regulator [Nocardiopsis sp. N85]|uniref:PadR family transcriptional regulator n=1 Tax=Nocardiopsis sp. N85 TaxID=3029400 RepID=UPI00237F011B|nr:PadR family transcriptional regulator [Nocardiopsis sp. N85]MDE3724734.1 PadR family transcriptional regulator [Nocardiopsis sp. N85]